MRIERTQLEAAAQRGIISGAQAGVLWTFLEVKQFGSPQFSFNHLLYYLGGMVAIGGISTFVTLGWENAWQHGPPPCRPCRDRRPH
jgi:hypothetical protein